MRQTELALKSIPLDRQAQNENKFSQIRSDGHRSSEGFQQLQLQQQQSDINRVSNNFQSDSARAAADLPTTHDLFSFDGLSIQPITRPAGFEWLTQTLGPAKFTKLEDLY